MTRDRIGSAARMGRREEAARAQRVEREPGGRRPPESALGTLIVIGGRERKTDGAVVLEEVVRHVGDGRLLVTAVASRHPEEMFETYRDAFATLGLTDVVPLHIRDRRDAREEANVRAFDGASGIFFTGGDQLRITSHIGDTPVYDRVRKLYREGGVVAGTSAGASALGDTMMVSGASDRSHRLGDLLKMAQGLELIEGLIIDQHFAQRGRMGRLLGAVAQSPGSLAIGVDEDTAVVVENGDSLRVIGTGTVYVVDGESMTHTNVGEGAEDRALSAHDLALHLLGAGDRYDLHERRPVPVEDVELRSPEEVREERRGRRHGERRRGDRRAAARRDPEAAREAPAAAGRRSWERRSGDRREDEDGASPDGGG